MSVLRRHLLISLTVLLLTIKLSSCEKAEEQPAPSEEFEKKTSEEPEKKTEGRQMGQLGQLGQLGQMGQMGSMYPQPIFQQSLLPPPSGFNNFIRRQFSGGMEALGDMVMLGMIGLPILGLLTVGGMSVANLFGLGGASTRKTSSGTNKRNRRGLVDKAAGAVQFVRSLWDIMEELEKSFEKYGIYESECRLRTVCEAHRSVPRIGSWGQTIFNLVRQQRELQSKEILPVARFLFSNYVEAARLGEKGANCPLSYPECTQNVSDFLSAEEDQSDNEVNIIM